jgi:Na+-driven multidrug efflux pump
VGHYLGDGNIKMAKAVSWITMVILGSEGLFVGIIFGGARSVIPRIFSNDPDVIREAKHVMLLVRSFVWTPRSAFAVCEPVTCACLS